MSVWKQFNSDTNWLNINGITKSLKLSLMRFKFSNMDSDSFYLDGSNLDRFKQIGVMKKRARLQARRSKANSARGRVENHG